MKFQTYYRNLSAAEKEAVAKRLLTTVNHLNNVACGKRVSPVMAIRIERETDGKVRAKDMRPDADWSLYVLPARRKPASTARAA